MSEPIVVTPRLMELYESSRGLPDEMAKAQKSAAHTRDYVRSIAADDDRSTDLAPDHPAVAGVRAMAADLAHRTWWDARNSMLPPTSESVAQARDGVARLVGTVDRIDERVAKGEPVNIDVVGNDISFAEKRFDEARWAASTETRALGTTVRLLAGHGGEPYDGATFKYLRTRRDKFREVKPLLDGASSYMESAEKALREFRAVNPDKRFVSGYDLERIVGPALGKARGQLVETYQNSGIGQPTNTYRAAQDAADLVEVAQRELYHQGDTGWNDVDVKLLENAVREAERAVASANRTSVSEANAMQTAADLVRRDPDKRASNWHRGPRNEPADWRR